VEISSRYRALPNEMLSRGYRITFKGTEWWDLTVPDYLQDDFGK